MNKENMTKIEEIVTSAFNYAKDHDIALPIDLAQLGSLIRFLHSDFAPQNYGHEKLRPLLDEMPSIVQVIKDDSISPPRYFASPLAAANGNSPLQQNQKIEPRVKIVRPGITDKLQDFAFIINQKWFDLAELARPENWGNKQELPMLRSYIKYTFARLVYEKKVKVSENGTAVAFNTGLVDRRFQPIFAFLVKNKNAANQPWFLEEFCVAGENFNGKMLVKTFNPLPESAYYFINPADAFYDINAIPYIDWEHVIEENSDRVPPELLSRITRGFEVLSCENMTNAEVEQYKQKLTEYLKKDDFAYRMLIDAFNRALELALKKVRWNYKTAIPVYYPTLHKLSMLLPLCMLAEDRVDLALVVERTESGNYQGHTIYPLDWAYSNARLIARPDSEWLQSESISESCSA